MSKTEDEKIFDEISKAMGAQDASTITTIVEVVDPPTEIKVEDPAPQEEVVNDEPPADDNVPAGEVVNTEGEQESEVDRLKRELEESKSSHHRLKSDAGRVPGLQRKLAELEKKLQEMADGTSAAKNEDGTDASEDAFDNEYFAVIRETDPTLAKAIEESLSRALKSNRKQSVEAARAVSETFREHENQQALQSEWETLVQVVPEAPTIFKSHEWRLWKETLTPEQRAMAESGYAEEVIEAVKHFNAAFLTKPAQAAPTTDAITEARQKKLQTVTPGSSPPSTPSNTSNDPEVLFRKAYDEMIKAQIRPR